MIFLSNKYRSPTNVYLSFGYGNAARFVHDGNVVRLSPFRYRLTLDDTGIVTSRRHRGLRLEAAL